MKSAELMLGLLLTSNLNKRRPLYLKWIRFGPRLYRMGWVKSLNGTCIECMLCGSDHIDLHCVQVEVNWTSTRGYKKNMQSVL